MISLLMPPSDPRDVSIKAHPYRFQSHVPGRKPDEVVLPLTDCLKKAVFIIVHDDGLRTLCEVAKVTDFVVSVEALDVVNDYVDAQARALLLGRPLLDLAAVHEALFVLAQKHGVKGECDACGKAVAIADLTKHHGTVTPPAKVCPDCKVIECGCPFHEDLGKKATQAAVEPPKEDRSWSYFAIRDGGINETSNLTLREATHLQLAELHQGGTWAAVFRSEKRFMILSDIEGEPPYESTAFQDEVDAHVALISTQKLSQ